MNHLYFRTPCSFCGIINFGEVPIPSTTNGLKVECRECHRSVLEFYHVEDEE